MPSGENWKFNQNQVRSLSVELPNKSRAISDFSEDLL